MIHKESVILILCCPDITPDNCLSNGSPHRVFCLTCTVVKHYAAYVICLCICMCDRVNDKVLFFQGFSQSSQQLKRKKKTSLFIYMAPQGGHWFIGHRWPLLGWGDKIFAASPPITTSTMNVGIPQPAGW